MDLIGLFLGGRNELWVAVICNDSFLIDWCDCTSGNIVLPFAGIINLSFVVGALLLTNGNVLRMIIHGLISTPLFLYGATYFTLHDTTCKRNWNIENQGLILGQLLKDQIFATY